MFDKSEIIALEISHDDYGGERKTGLVLYFRGGSHINLTGEDAESVWKAFSENNSPD
jgi:hypothetical protein